MSNKLNITLLSDKSYQISESLKTLRTNLLFCGRDIKVITITSSIPNEGKSVVSLELAASLAKLDKKTLFIDADMRKSVMTKRYKTPALPGLSQFLSGQATIEDVICETQLPTLDVMMCGFYPPNPVELLTSDHFQNFLNDMREKYDYVIIDTPPLGAVIDAAIISKISDGTLMIVAKDKVSYRFAQSVRDQLIKSGCKILGVVLNFYKTTTSINSKYRYNYESRKNIYAYYKQ